MFKRNKIKMLNKKAQVTGIILAVVIIFIVGILLLFLSHLNKEVYDKFDKYFEQDVELNNTEAHQTVEKLQEVEGSRIWDYAFLAIFIGMIIQMIVLAFASRTNVLFFWIYVLLGIVILIISVVVSNVWQEIAQQSEFATTILRFPITNTILGTYYPTFITGFLFLGLIFIFGKFPGQTED